MSQGNRSTVLAAAQEWKDAFNRQDAAGCAACYTADATMHAEPLARAQGREEIQTFWQGLIDAGFRDVEYLDPKVELLSDSKARLTSPWTMNRASGRIHNETWELSSEGQWLLTYDHFEVLEQFEDSKT
ncbi:MAG: nuclear transport factor 2 family protein [Deltaproteobacteria bacterium]|nr:nuclear transport factor 2 family protein [Deltaproteobacteria bacterium]